MAKSRHQGPVKVGSVHPLRVFNSVRQAKFAGLNGSPPIIHLIVDEGSLDATDGLLDGLALLDEFQIAPAFPQYRRDAFQMAVAI